MRKRHPRACNPSFHNVSRFSPRATVRSKMWLGTAARIQAKRRSLTWSLALDYQIRTRVLLIHHPRSPTPWPALKRGLAGASDAEAQRRLAEFGNELEEVAHEALLLMFREVRRFVPSTPYDFLRLTPDLLVLRSSRCLLRIVVDRQHRARD